MMALMMLSMPSLVSQGCTLRGAFWLLLKLLHFKHLLLVEWSQLGLYSKRLMMVDSTQLSLTSSMDSWCAFRRESAKGFTKQLKRELLQSLHHFRCASSLQAPLRATPSCCCGEAETS